MDVREAVATRYSCRAFLDKPVALATVREILSCAARAPSGGNLQPWRVHALAGKRLAALIDLVRPRFNELPRAEGTEYQIYPQPLKEPYYTRRAVVGNLLYRSINVPREDRAARYRQYARNFEFFGAPVGLMVSTDDYLPDYDRLPRAEWDNPDHADLSRLSWIGHQLPFECQLGQCIAAGKSIFRQLLITARAVIADSRAIYQHLGIASRCLRTLRQGLDNVLGAVDPAVTQQLLEFIVPATGKDRFTHQVNHRVAILRGLHPRPGLHRIAFDNRALAAPACLSVSRTTSQHDNSVASFSQAIDE